MYKNIITVVISNTSSTRKIIDNNNKRITNIKLKTINAIDIIFIINVTTNGIKIDSNTVNSVL